MRSPCSWRAASCTSSSGQVEIGPLRRSDRVGRHPVARGEPGDRHLDLRFCEPLRWTWLLRPVGRVPFWPSFLATAVGFAANNLPARVGEVIRPALLARMRRLPFSALLASILFERALDGGSVLVFLLLAVLLGIPGSTAGGAAFAMMRTGALVAAAVFVVLVGAALVLLFRRDAAARLFGRLADRLPPPGSPA